MQSTSTLEVWTFILRESANESHPLDQVKSQVSNRSLFGIPAVTGCQLLPAAVSGEIFTGSVQGTKNRILFTIYSCLVDLYH